MHFSSTEELRRLRQELQDRDVVTKRLKSKLGAQCALELEKRKLQQELRQFKDGMARLLQQEPHLRDKLAAMTVFDNFAYDSASGSVEKANVPSGLESLHIGGRTKLSSQRSPQKKSHIWLF